MGKSYTCKKVAGGYAPNPVPASSVKQAADLYTAFTGHDADYFNKINIKTPKAALLIGEVDGIMYSTTRDNKREKYIHKFKNSARPVLAASHDGSQLLLIGGNFRFTDRGIVDN